MGSAPSRPSRPPNPAITTYRHWLTSLRHAVPELEATRSLGPPRRWLAEPATSYGPMGGAVGLLWWDERDRPVLGFGRAARSHGPVARATHTRQAAYCPLTLDASGRFMVRDMTAADRRLVGGGTFLQDARVASRRQWFVDTRRYDADFCPYVTSLHEEGDPPYLPERLVLSYPARPRWLRLAWRDGYWHIEPVDPALRADFARAEALRRRRRRPGPTERPRRGSTSGRVRADGRALSREELSWKESVAVIAAHLRIDDLAKPSRRPDEAREETSP